jgi:EAL domain-containing protein (putative c-di-GMP-specific phosphodiesterase class I)
MRLGARPAPFADALDLLAAVERGEMRLHYQGLFELGDPLRPAGHEALARWEHPERGLLLPSAFLPPELDGELGWALTIFALEEAIRQSARWRRSGMDGSVSVNIAPGMLAEEMLPTYVQDLLDRHGVPAPALTLEITEGRAAIDPAGIGRALAVLQEVGVRLSLDDFGTGDSSLTRLRETPFDEIKIDRMFVTGLPSGRVDLHIVEHVTELAHRLGAVVVAEGIETAASLDVLRGLSVDRGQGFLLDRPQAILDLT